ncbi:MAG TPA: helix-hairpin-helix domain-containing protein [Acidimicrobiales bacterium]|nr:helix-hairpin-helix domain-containing protein [Acidimicrobiales bacterium]
MAEVPSFWRERLAAAPALLRSPRLMATGAVAGGLAVAVALLVVATRGAPASPEVALPMAPGAGAAPPAGVTTTAPAGGGSVLVDAAGAVARPGVYRVPPGGRVTDLLDAAGGALPDADLDQLNLAAKVADGDRVFVPRRGQAPPPPLAGAGTAAPAGGPVDLNTATLAELDGLPGVGPATAQAIVDYRTEHGRFARVDDLAEVRGIGPAKLAALRPKVRV